MIIQIKAQKFIFIYNYCKKFKKYSIHVNQFLKKLFKSF